jgi:hypothetical protein
VQSSYKLSGAQRRFVGTAIILFVFFLPLHHHFSTAAAQAKEDCVCQHGSLTLLGLAPPQLHLTPQFAISSLILPALYARDRYSVSHKTIRAPPRISSL